MCIQNLQMESTSGTYKATRYAVKLEPPCVFLEYSDDMQQCRVREVKLSISGADLDVDRLTKKVIRSFPRKLDRTTVSYRQVRKLVFKLVEHYSAAQKAGLTKPVANSPAKVPAASSDPKEQPVPTQPKSSGMDLDLDDLDRELADLGLGTSTSKQSHNGPASLAKLRPLNGSTNGVSGLQHKPSVPAADDRLELEPACLIPPDADLNKLPDELLQKAKAVMDQDFVKNRLKPGDPGFEYDKRVEFQPVCAANEWDDDEDEQPSVSGVGDDDEGMEEEIDWEEIARATSKKAGGLTALSTPRSTRSTVSGESSADWP